MISIRTEDAAWALLFAIVAGLIVMLVAEAVVSKLRGTAVDGRAPFFGWLAACMTGLIALSAWDLAKHVRIEWLP